MGNFFVIVWGLMSLTYCNAGVGGPRKSSMAEEIIPVMWLSRVMSHMQDSAEHYTYIIKNLVKRIQKLSYNNSIEVAVDMSIKFEQSYKMLQTKFNNISCTYPNPGKLNEFTPMYKSLWEYMEMYIENKVLYDYILEKLYDAYNVAVMEMKQTQSTRIEKEILIRDANDTLRAIKTILEILRERFSGIEHEYPDFDKHGLFESKIIVLLRTADNLTSDILQEEISKGNIKKAEQVVMMTGDVFEEVLALFNEYSAGIVKIFKKHGIKLNKYFKMNLSNELRILAYRPYSRAIPKSVNRSNLYPTIKFQEKEKSRKVNLSRKITKEPSVKKKIASKKEYDPPQRSIMKRILDPKREINYLSTTHFTLIHLIAPLALVLLF
ncbi:hypothetical protein BdWA1_002112 [Babesia duncani]|uniref:Uncharacterized protein n=1 Tax=Babesia duncani TaxID=323732 RepID=A0AAD9PL70_9APIC|nr:hypothetical protein BdWA1_002112 [Babesia duncani]